MAVFDFLISALLAVDYNNRAKEYKWKGETRNAVLKKVHDDNNIIENIMYRFGNREYEDDVLDMIDEDGPKLLEKYIRMAPSYNNSKEFNCSMNGKVGSVGYDNRKILKRLLLSEKGVISSGDLITFFPAGESCCNLQGGRERPVYENQIRHELMVMWDQKMRENGFPYTLMMNKNCGSVRRISECDPVYLVPNYRVNRMYFWDTEMNGGRRRF